MSCGSARNRLSAYLDQDLDPREAREIARHLAECGGCARRWRELRAAVESLAELPPLRVPDGITAAVRDRIELETRGPGLALLFRPAWHARPLILPSLVPAALVLVTVLAASVALHQDPRSLPVAALNDVWEGRLPAWGSEANPLFPSTEVSTPQPEARTPAPEELQLAEGVGALFVETVVARDGSVSTVTLLEGDSEAAAPILDALRRQRFEPGRYRGRPVAVSLYRLISRTEVVASVT